jgi:death on curing protein
VTRCLTLDDLLFITSQACGQVHVRDYGLLASALARPAATVFGSDAYPSLHTKAAALLHSLASNHALVDGNKRLAWAAGAVFLGINGHRPHASQDDVVHLVVSVANGTRTDIDKIAERLAIWSKPASV